MKAYFILSHLLFFLLISTIESGENRRQLIDGIKSQHQIDCNDEKQLLQKWMCDAGAIYVPTVENMMYLPSLQSFYSLKFWGPQILEYAIEESNRQNSSSHYSIGSPWLTHACDVYILEEGILEYLYYINKKIQLKTVTAQTLLKYYMIILQLIRKRYPKPQIYISPFRKSSEIKSVWQWA